MKFLLTILFILASLLTNAQVTFQRMYGKQGGMTQVGYGIQQTFDGGFIIVGGSSDSSNTDGHVIRTDNDGNTLWAKSYGTTLLELFNSVQQTTDGGFIMTGYIDDTTNMEVNGYLLKMDSNGNLQWDKSFAGTGYNYAMSVLITSDGGYIVSRQFSYEISLLKMDWNGNVQWNKLFGNSSLFSLSLGWPNDITKTKDGGFILTGSITSFTSSDRNVYLLKTDSSGNVLWNKSFRTQKKEYGASVIETHDGGFFIVGTVDTLFANDERALLIKTDSDGNLQWSKMSGEIIYGLGAAATSDSGIVFTGLLIDTLLNLGYGVLYKVDYNGNLLWEKDYLDSSFSLVTEILETQDDGLAMIGYKSDSNNIKTLLIKTDQDGNSNCLENNLSDQLINYPMSVDTPLITVNPISDSVSSGFTISFNQIKADSILCTTAGIQNHSGGIQQVIIYPNPFSTTARLEIQSSMIHVQNLQMKVYNVFGQEVKNSVIRNRSSLIERGNLPNGIYFYTFSGNPPIGGSQQSENKIPVTGKFIIQ